jgi:hypothetical protein
VVTSRAVLSKTHDADIILIASRNFALSYFACYLAASGIYPLIANSKHLSTYATRLTRVPAISWVVRHEVTCGVLLISFAVEQQRRPIPPSGHLGHRHWMVSD